MGKGGEMPNRRGREAKLVRWKNSQSPLLANYAFLKCVLLLEETLILSFRILNIVKDQIKNVIICAL